MRLVQQKDNYCVPACLESIFFDKDVGINKTQDEIVQDNPDVFKGGVPVDSWKLADVFKKYGIRGSFNHDDINEKYDSKKLKKIASNPNNKILLIWRNSSKHCVRLVDIKTNGDLEVMDPQLGKYDIYNTERQKELNLGVIYFTIAN